jgi:hypothetical protein
MCTTFFRLLVLPAVLALTAMACNLPVSRPVPETATQLVQPMIEASATLDLAATQTRQAALLPTGTSTIQTTDASLPDASATTAVEIPQAKVNRETNCRLGPGGMYDLVATYQAGQVLDVLATGLAQGYWFVQNPEKPEEQCYLMAQNVTISGDTSALPKFTPQPSPTPPPYFNAKFKKIDNCNGNRFANFSVENTGNIDFRSVYIKVTDTKVNKSVEQVLNVFDLYVGCILAKNISPLDPGETGYVPSPAFTWNIHEDKLSAVIMLCTENGLKGICVTRTVDVKK